MQDSSSEEEEYEVECILKCRETNKKKEYLTSWKNYSSDHNSWEPFENVGDTEAMDRFEKKNKKKKKIKKKIRLVSDSSDDEEKKEDQKEEAQEEGEVEGEFKIEKILDYDDNMKCAQIRWEGYDESHDSWEPLANVADTVPWGAYQEKCLKEKQLIQETKKKKKTKKPQPTLMSLWDSPRAQEKKKGGLKRKISDASPPQDTKKSKISEQEIVPKKKRRLILVDEEEKIALVEPELKEEKKALEEEAGYIPSGDEEVDDEEFNDADDEDIEFDEVKALKASSILKGLRLLAESSGSSSSEEEEIKTVTPPKKKTKKKKQKIPIYKSEDEEVEEEKTKKQKLVHGRKLDTGPVWFDVDKLSDLSSSEDEDPKYLENLKKCGRTKAFKLKEKKAKQIKGIVGRDAKTGKYKVTWKNESHTQFSMEPEHKIRHTNNFIVYCNKNAVNGYTGKTAKWQKSDDRFLFKLSKKKGYRKLGKKNKSGAHDFYKYAMSTKRSIISVRNRLKRAKLIPENKKRKKKPKKKKDESAVIDESNSREGSNFKSNKNRFISKKVSVGDQNSKKLMKELRITPKEISSEIPELTIDMKKLEGHQIIFIIGKTGSGKTTLLNNIGELFETPKWKKDKAIVSQIHEDDQLGRKSLSSVGLNSIPSWMKPFHVLSQGEAYRALLAKTIAKCYENPEQWILLDNFTNSLDRVSARSCAGSLQKCIRRDEKNFKNCKFILASSNYDLIPFLQPTLVIQIKNGEINYMENPNEEYELDVKAKYIGSQQEYNPKKLPLMKIPAAKTGDLRISKEVDCSTMPFHVLKTTVKYDDSVGKASSIFDHPFKGEIKFSIPPFPEKEIENKDFKVGFISGPSGTGKTSLAWQYFGAPFNPKWKENTTVVSHFNDFKEAMELFKLVGLEKEDGLKCFDQLCEGMKERAIIGLGLSTQKEGEYLVIDEFTSHQDRIFARTLSKNISEFCRKTNRKILFVACHDDLLDSSGLSPNFWYSTKTKNYVEFKVPKIKRTAQFPDFTTSVVFRRPQIELDLIRVKNTGWGYFAEHHYKDPNCRNFARSYVAYADFVNFEIPRDLVAWTCHIPGQQKDKDLPATPYIEHRTVVLPDFQGLGFASRICDCIAELCFREGSLFQSKTAHYRYGRYRDDSPLWVGMASNHEVQSKPVNWKNPFGSKKERHDEEWESYKKNWQPRTYFNHKYLGIKTDKKRKKHFFSRCIFEDS